MREETLVHNLVKHRHLLDGMLTAMVGSAAHTEDLFQEVALIMTRKREDLPEDCPFIPWGRAIAFNVVRDYRRKAATNRVQLLPDTAMELVADIFEKTHAGAWDARRQALDECTDELPDRDRTLLQHRYHDGCRVDELAVARSTTRGAIDTMLYRIRKALELCVEGKLTQRGSS